MRFKRNFDKYIVENVKQLKKYNKEHKNILLCLSYRTQVLSLVITETELLVKVLKTCII